MAGSKRTTIGDLMGRTFGRLTTINSKRRESDGRVVYLCRCSCGNQVTVQARYLAIGHTQSCGCLQIDACTTHGMAALGRRDLGYRAWNAMLQRCTNQNRHGYSDYGGAGIRVCDRWLTFENFLRDMGPRPIGGTIDRIDNGKGYSKDNCRWATQKEQQRNRRNNRKVTFNGHTKCLSEWAEEYGLYGSLISARLRCGWSVERALTTPNTKR